MSSVLDVAGRIRRMRELRGLSTTELGEQSGLSQQYISNIENNHKMPTIKALGQIAQALRVPIAYFFDEQGATPFDVLPEMDPELKALLLSYKVMPYLRLTEKAVREGVDPEVLTRLLEAAIALSKHSPQSAGPEKEQD